VLLPVGISFYIFQAVGYAVDVYRGTIKAEKNFVVYALFISFFPQLVAGPIERAKNMLPQFREKHKFSYENFDAGLRLMIGVIDASNENSIRFHKKFGFESIGILKEVGFKFNRWLDANLMQLKL
jgi:hypothetical protein